jgi:hypothetical protein
MRGQIDLASHKLAGLYRPPAKRERWRTTRWNPNKKPDIGYRQIWRIVDGAVRDTFANHPEYLSNKHARATITASIVKRVAGSLHGWAAQTAQGRSVRADDDLRDAAAANRTLATDTASDPARFTRAVGFAPSMQSLWQRFKGAARNSLGGARG